MILPVDANKCKFDALSAENINKNRDPEIVPG